MVYCKLKSKTLLPVGERARRFGLNGVGRGEEKENKNKGALLTRETVGMTLLLFSAVILFIAVTGQYVFGEIGLAITAFFMGLAGYCIYPLLLLALYGSAVMVFGKKFIPARWLWRVCLLIAAVFLNGGRRPVRTHCLSRARCALSGGGIYFLFTAHRSFAVAHSHCDPASFRPSSLCKGAFGQAHGACAES